MLSLVLAVMLRLCLGSSDAHALAVQYAYRFQLDGQAYTVVILGENNPYRKNFRSSPEDEEAARKLEVLSRRWAISRLRQAHGDVELANPGFFSMLEEKDPPNDGRSTTIVIYRDNSPWDIEATLRIAWPSKERPLLPSESMFDFRFPEVHRALRPFGDWRWIHEHLEVDPLTPSRVQKIRKAFPERPTEGSIELKQLALKDPTRAQWAAYLLYFAEISHSLSVNLRDHFETGIMVSPYHLALTCDRKMVAYYKRMGFHLVFPKPVYGRTFAMVATRPQFLLKTMPLLTSRAEFRKVMEATKPRTFAELVIRNIRDEINANLRNLAFDELFLMRPAPRKCGGLLED